MKSKTQQRARSNKYRWFYEKCRTELLMLESDIEKLLAAGVTSFKIEGRMRRADGIDAILENVCKLDPKGSLAMLVKEKIEMLTGLGYIK